FIIQHGLYFGYDYSRESVIIDENVLKIEIEKELEQYPGLLFIEGHTSEIVPMEFVKFTFILRCNPSILRERLSLTRDYSHSKIEENIQAEIQLPSSLILEIDTSNLIPENVVEQIISRISKA
ncbi:MAG: AAA family ATPase, partial [Candidatus Heimdallarchaeota archaeon]|nr:AAA family ATPase [Candidatus Heimdallarchaeota archaeon]